MARRTILASLAVAAALAVTALAAPSVRPPKGTPNLGAMALRTQDIPGSGIDHQGYVKPDRAVASYDREFTVGGARLGRSLLVGLENQVELERSALQASIFLTVLRSSGKRLFEQYFGSLFRQGSGGLQVKNLGVVPLAVRGVGDEIVAYRATFETKGIRFAAAFYFVRVGRVIGTIYTAGGVRVLHNEDTTALARRLAARIRLGLARSGSS